MIPICVKLSPNPSFRIGYSAGMSDCRVSLNKWATLSATRTRIAVRSGGAAGWTKARDIPLYVCLNGRAATRLMVDDRVVRHAPFVGGGGAISNRSFPLGP